MSYSVKKIEWIDSCASNMNWSILEGFEIEAEPIKIVSYGVQVQENEDYIVIAQNFGTNPLQFCSLMSIPKGCIKKITDIDSIMVGEDEEKAQG